MINTDKQIKSDQEGTFVGFVGDCEDPTATSNDFHLGQRIESASMKTLLEVWAVEWLEKTLKDSTDIIGKGYKKTGKIPIIIIIDDHLFKHQEVSLGTFKVGFRYTGQLDVDGEYSLIMFRGVEATLVVSHLEDSIAGGCIVFLPESRIKVALYEVCRNLYYSLSILVTNNELLKDKKFNDIVDRNYIMEFLSKNKEVFNELSKVSTITNVLV